jgi:hypothetical protein
MAEIKRLVPTKNLKRTLLNHLAESKSAQVFVNYDEDFDALMILFVPPETPTVVHYLDEHVGLLYRTDDQEIVGLQVESFESSFVPAHDAVKSVWKLSEAVGAEVKDVGDMMLIVERAKPQVAKEVIRSVEDLPEEMVAALP